MTKSTALHPFSLLAGCGLAAIALLTMGYRSAAPAPGWEYKSVTDASQDEITKLASEGWEYVGYLGQSTRGTSIDETLWKRPVK